MSSYLSLIQPVCDVGGGYVVGDGLQFKTNAESDDMLRQLRSQLENGGKPSDEKDVEPPESTTSATKASSNNGITS